MAGPSNSGNQYEWDQWFAETIVSQDNTDVGYRWGPLPNDCNISHFIAAAASTIEDDDENTLVQEALPDLLFPEDAFVPSSSIT
ncbi:hypothetical protein SCLCIDRAFT_31173 [Scleroderma citrinum Foug A]|uniref:Uncharacterized protein n=1 Tax=Scleroderma citrinum Foug A TaxID=1036808 RepID=A0A0C2YXH3_9AGAM|nr:hypothetical protein SCLCIDRAFT_31173 [Scleroderma citrinum Foug A]